MSKKYTVNQGFMSLSTYYLEDDPRNVARIHRRRRRGRRAYAPTSNTASHNNHEKINSWVSFSFLYGYGLRYDVLINSSQKFLKLKSRNKNLANRPIKSV